MPSVEYTFRSPDDASVSGEAVIVSNVLKLRQTDDNGDFDRGGTFKTGTAVLPTKTIERLGEFHSFEVTDSGGGTVLWQLSGDGGSSFYWHDGAYWTLAGASDGTSTDNFAKNISSFPKNFGRDFVLKAILSGSTDGTETPLISYVALHLDFERFDFLEEAKRSLKKFIEDNTEVSEIERTTLQVPSDTITLRTQYETVKEIKAVYNLTDDPNRADNLFSSFTAPGTVTLTSSQAINSDIEVQFTAVPTLILGADPDYVKTKLPGMVIETPTMSEQRERRIGDRRKEKNIPLETSRVRSYFVHQEISVRIRCTAPYETQTTRMAEALARTFQQFRNVPNLGTGENFDIVDFGPIIDNDLIAQELREKDVSFLLVGRDWVTPEFEQLPLAKEFVLGFGDFEEKLEEEIVS